MVLGTGRGSLSQTWYAADINIVNRPCVHVAGGVKTVVSAGVSKFKMGVGRSVSDDEEGEVIVRNVVGVLDVRVWVKVVWLATADAMIEAMYKPTKKDCLFG